MSTAPAAIQPTKKTLGQRFRRDLGQHWPAYLMILPATSSLIPIGETVKKVVPLHTLMLHDSRVFAAVAEFLEKEEGR